VGTIKVNGGELAVLEKQATSFVIGGVVCSYFSRDLENLSPNLSPNLSLALSYKEREAEYIFLFGDALNSPPWNKKRSILLIPSCILKI